MNDSVQLVLDNLLEAVNDSDNPVNILKSAEFKQLYANIPKLDISERKNYGESVNNAKKILEQAIENRIDEIKNDSIDPIDITAPWDINSSLVPLLPAQFGTIHPLSREIETVVGIFNSMGFEAIESRQIDSDYNMFEALNFPKGHPARDGYDTFRTEEGFIPPAHTSTMQNRILKSGKDRLESGGQIAVVSYGRVFRNEDVDATHEHTFYQCEGVFVSKDATMGDMLGTLREFFESYYGQTLKIKTQPAYFPFVEPGL